MVQVVKSSGRRETAKLAAGFAGEGRSVAVVDRQGRRLGGYDPRKGGFGSLKGLPPRPADVLRPGLSGAVGRSVNPGRQVSPQVGQRGGSAALPARSSVTLNFGGGLTTSFTFDDFYAGTIPADRLTYHLEGITDVHSHDGPVRRSVTLPSGDVWSFFALDTDADELALGILAAAADEMHNAPRNSISHRLGYSIGNTLDVFSFGLLPNTLRPDVPDGMRTTPSRRTPINRNR